MTATTQVAPPGRTLAALWRVGPPGLVFYALTLLAVLLALDANSRQSLSALLVVVPIWFGVAAAWTLRLILAGQRAGWRLAPVDWSRWLLIPLIMGAVFLVTRTDVLVEARLDLSRGAMDAMAADVMAGGTLDRGWVGLYDVGAVVLSENGLRFVVDDSGLGRWGFAYSTSGAPVFIETEDEQYDWQGLAFDPIGGGWWRWTEQWN